MWLEHCINLFLALQVHQMAVSLFRLIGSIGRSMVVTNTLGSFSLLIVFVLGGFIIAKRDIHPWWIWAYWISPLRCAKRSNVHIRVSGWQT